MRFPLLCVLGAVVGVGPAHATYDLLLVADQGGGGQSARIHRYDATTGRYLGFFGDRIAGVTAVAAIRDLGRAYTINSNGYLQTWDYSTGISYGVSRSDLGGHQLLAFGNRLFAYNNLRLLEISPATGESLATTAAPSGEQFVFLTRDNDNWYAGLRSASGSRIARSPASIASWQSLTPITAANQLGTTVAQGAVLPNPDFTWVVGPTSTAGTDMRYAWTTSVLTGDWGISALTANWRGYSAGHDFLYMTGTLASDATQARIGYIDYRLNLNSGGVFGGPELRTPVALASVVAPEPGTLLALGAGLAVLARRRRRR